MTYIVSGGALNYSLTHHKKDMEIKFFLHKSPSKRWSRNEIHSLIRWAYARWSTDTIYRMWRISLLCR